MTSGATAPQTGPRPYRGLVTATAVVLGLGAALGGYSIWSTAGALSDAKSDQRVVQLFLEADRAQIALAAEQVDSSTALRTETTDQFRAIGNTATSQGINNLGIDASESGAQVMTLLKDPVRALGVARQQGGNALTVLSLTLDQVPSQCASAIRDTSLGRNAQDYAAKIAAASASAAENAQEREAALDKMVKAASSLRSSASARVLVAVFGTAIALVGLIWALTRLTRGRRGPAASGAPKARPAKTPKAPKAPKVPALPRRERASAKAKAAAVEAMPLAPDEAVAVPAPATMAPPHAPALSDATEMLFHYEAPHTLRPPHAPVRAAGAQPPRALAGRGPASSQPQPGHQAQPPGRPSLPDGAPTGRPARPQPPEVPWAPSGAPATPARVPAPSLVDRFAPAAPLRPVTGPNATLRPVTGQGQALRPATGANPVVRPVTGPNAGLRPVSGPIPAARPRPAAGGGGTHPSSLPTSQPAGALTPAAKGVYARSVRPASYAPSAAVRRQTAAAAGAPITTVAGRASSRPANQPAANSFSVPGPAYPATASVPPLAGLFGLEPPLSLEDTLAEALAQVERPHQVRWAIAATAQVPATIAPRLAHVVADLVDAATAKSPALAVLVSAQANDTVLQVAVSDRAPGPPPGRDPLGPRAHAIQMLAGRIGATVRATPGAGGRGTDVRITLRLMGGIVAPPQG
ncbi:MAG: hypothetical protein LBR27_01005 [Bifidobacteriaceae bacterium]|jgi:hypothetical protein|nr:hypothetical protein [Bifidobacteriaceae bacterium]